MIEAIIVEDELYIRKGLRILIERLNIGVKIIDESISVRDAIKKTQLLKPNLIFLDIKLLDGTAFDFLEKTKEQDFKVIFITSYENYAIQAIKTGAVDYILKPIDINELKTAIEKVKVLLNKNSIVKPKEENKIILKSTRGIQIIKLNELIFCKSNKGYTTFYLKSGEHYLASKPLKEYENQLLNNHFIRTHQSYFINVSFIEKFDSKHRLLHLKNNITVPVAARKVAAINKILKN